MTILGAVRHSLIQMWREQIRYHQIYGELREMNRRELADLGLSRDDAMGIALNTVRAERKRATQPAATRTPARALVQA